jgi:hypothetical protein
MKVIKAIYNFIVGDMVILLGVMLTVLILIVLNVVPLFAALRGASSVILIVAVLVILLATLRREVSARG